MPYKIAMVAQKGGVGKSTLARMIAVEAAKGGLQAKIADLDTQQSTCVHWAGSGVLAAVCCQRFGRSRSRPRTSP